MKILDTSKLKDYVVEELKLKETLQNQAKKEFLKKPENKNYNLEELLEKMMKGNNDWLSGKNVKNWFSKGEMLFLAKYNRFIVEYGADYSQETSPILDDVDFKTIKINDFSAEWQIPPKVKDNKVLLYFHGGGHVLGSPNYLKLVTVNISKATDLPVLSINYSLAPEHPYPKPIEDCIGSYQHLLNEGYQPKDIIIGGESAGGYYTLSTLLYLKNRNISLPAAAICLAPSIDLASTSKSYQYNKNTDYLADLGLYWWIECYLNSANPLNPEVSPMYADLSGLPPILLQVSKSEMLYEDSTRFFKKAKDAGVDIILQEWEDMLHVFHHYDFPETKEAIEKIGKFVERIFERN
jgi:acetyl esterase/lipase